MHLIMCQYFDVIYIKQLPKFNMEPENDGFQEKSPFPGADFQVHHIKLQGFISDHSVHSNVLCVLQIAQTFSGSFGG